MYREQKICRGPLAASFNALPNTSWVPNINISFSKKFGNENDLYADYDSGRPDAFVFHNGRIFCVECKAAVGRFPLNDWSLSQRNWYEKIVKPSKTAYLIGLAFLESEISNEPDLYLLPAARLLQYEFMRSEKSISFEDARFSFGDYSLTKVSRRLYSVEKCFDYSV